MDRQSTKSMVSRLLRQSILELCKASVPQEQGVAIDGIVCISIGDDEDDQIVVKVHEQMGIPRSVSQVSSSNGFRHAVADVEGLSEYQRKRQNLHSIAQAASAKRLRTLSDGFDSEDVVESSSSAITKSICNDSVKMKLLTTIKTEIPTDEEELSQSENSSIQGKDRSTVSAQISKYFGNASLDTMVFRNLECEHCKVLLPSFEDLKLHNEQEHKTSTCEYCWRSFLNFSNYQQHLKSHRKMRVGARSKNSQKEQKSKLCGICSDIFKSYSQMIEHLRAAHEFERCFTCITCEKYFPNRQSFISHREKEHSDVQQCRCENCEIYLTYVEFKHHEKECFSPDVVDHARSKHPIDCQNKNSRNNLLHAGRTSEMQLTEVTQIDTDQVLHLDANNVLGQILSSEHSILEQTKALVTIKSKELESSKIAIQNDSSNFSDNAMHDVADQKNLNNENDDSFEESDDDEDDEDSENSSEENQDFFTVLNSPNLKALLTTNNMQNEASSSFQEKNTPYACSGPYRCQTCFLVIEQFEEFERHCFEMHCRYVCTYCAQTFANRRNLQRHIRRHNGDMPYVCDECGQRFYRDDNLRRHKLKHMTSVRFICSYCNMQCDTKNKLTSHLIGGHAIDVLKVTEQEILKHVILKDDPVPTAKSSDRSELLYASDSVEKTERLCLN